MSNFTKYPNRPYFGPPFLYICTKCGQVLVDTKCPQHGGDFIRTRDAEEMAEDEDST